MNPPRSPTRHERLRLALKIARQLGQARAGDPGPLPEYEWQRLMKVSRWLELASRRGWTATVPRLRRQHVSLVRSVVSHLEDRQRTLEEMRDQRPVASIGDILADMDALKAEFGDLAIDLKNRTLSVVTPSVVLESIELGRFEIVVQVDCLGDSSPYDVIALDPNPAAESSDTVHPHVQSESLCEGEGRAAIRRASADGRVFDLCVIVHQILQTYHSGSAYVPLSRWKRRTCRDCGTNSSEDESTTCGRCEDELCHDCVESCAGCGHGLCSSCRSRCADCDSAICDGCLQPCAGCGEGHCPNCLNSEECATCLEESETLTEENNDEETLEEAVEGTSEPAKATDPAVHALGVGEVLVPA
jgi:hypothetical protein